MRSRHRARSRLAHRALTSWIAGSGLGLAVALLLRAAIQRTATPLSPERSLWQLLLLSFAGGLVGFALSTVSALQAGNPDPEYHRPRRTLRPSSRQRGDRAS